MSTEIEVQKESEIIAEFMGLVTSDTNEWVKTNKQLIGKYEYHSSWSWQIPVWSKLWREVISWLYNSPTDIEQFLKERKQFKIFEHNYLSAISTNSSADGFEIILITLNWYKTNNHST